MGSINVARRSGSSPGARSSGHEYAWRWWLTPLVVLAAAALFVAAYYPVAKVQYRETREKARLESELTALKARNQRLQVQVDRLNTPGGIEDYARSLGMVRRGETVVIVAGSAPATISATTGRAPRIDSEEAVKPPVGRWTAFLDAVFSIR